MNRRILFFILLAILFSIGIIIWFFFFAIPSKPTTLGGPSDPFLPRVFPKRFQFILNNDDEENATSTTEVIPEKMQALTKIWDKPATGQVFVSKDIVREVDATSTVGTTTVSVKRLVHSTSTFLYFVDRTTGHIHSYNRDLNTLYQITNTTIPGIYDAYIFENGRRVVFRYGDIAKKTIITVVATIPDFNEKVGPAALENISYLPLQVASIAKNKDGTLLSYMVTGENGASIYTITKTGSDVVASTPLKEWSLSYGGDKLYATSKPSAYVEGQTVLLPSFEFIVGNKTGLMDNPSEGVLHINSMWSSRGLKTFITDSGKQTVLSIATLASKCAWGKRDFLVCAVPKKLPHVVEGLPDDWLQGMSTFDDSLWVVDSKSGDSYVLYDFTENNIPRFDISSLLLSTNNVFISIIRKQDSSLWFLDRNYLSDN